jgi:hypothetical protein
MTNRGVVLASFPRGDQYPPGTFACPACEYDLGGMDGEREVCPECGAAFDRTVLGSRPPLPRRLEVFKWAIAPSVIYFGAGLVGVFLSAVGLPAWPIAAIVSCVAPLFLLSYGLTAPSHWATRYAVPPSRRRGLFASGLAGAAATLAAWGCLSYLWMRVI